MRRVHLEEADARQHALHVGGKRLPAAALDAAPAELLEVVDDDEAAFLDVGAQRRRLAIGQRPPSDLDDVRHRILEQRGIIERRQVDVVEMGIEKTQVSHDAHQIPLGEREAVRPRRAAAGPVAVGCRFILDADEGELPVVGDVFGCRHAAAKTEPVEAALRERRSGEANDHRDHEPAARHDLIVSTSGGGAPRYIFPPRSERETYDTGTIPVVRNPWAALRDGERRIEAERELTERASRITRFLHFGVHRIFARCRRHIHHAAFREAQLQVLDRTSVPLRWRKRDHALDRLFDRRHADRSGRQFDLLVDQHDAFGRARLRRIAVLQVDRPIPRAKAQVGAERRRDMHLAFAQRGRKALLRRTQCAIVRRQQRALVQSVDRGSRRQRLSRNRIRAPVLDPMEVDGPSAAMLPEVFLQPILHRRVRRMRRCRARHHHRRVHVPEHCFVIRARVAGAFGQYRRVERFGHRLRQNLDDAEIDAAGAHHFVAQIR